MKLLVVQGRPTYPFLLGGAARVTHRLLRALSLQKNVNVYWLGRGVSQGQIIGLLPRECEWESLGVQSIRRTASGMVLDLSYPCEVTTNFGMEFKRRLESDKPDFVWAQLENACDLISAATSYSIPTMLYQMDCVYKEVQVQAIANHGTQIACLSRYIAEHVSVNTGCDAEVLYPIIESASSVDEAAYCDHSECVLMVNPHALKGLAVFLRFASLLPNVLFRLQECWPLNAEDLMKLNQDLATLPNVTFHRRVTDMRPVYASASLLVVPSVWEEGFGMVVTEAQAAGVPVIASRRGGLPESVGMGGILIDDSENASVWSNAIDRVINDRRLSDRLRNAALVSLQRPEFSESNVLAKFFQIFNRSRPGLSLFR